MSETFLGPLPFFDYHLKTLDESYIQFFQERVRIEEIYVDSLRRLHLKHRALDSYRDDRADRVTSVRKAWREVEDNAERETETREAFLENLKSEVLNPLLALRETQERTRKRIKEDLKNAAVTHIEFAENMLPRLKRHYLRKCQDVEDHKSDRFVLSGPSNLVASEQTDHPLTKVASNPIGSPTPIRPITRQPSAHQAGSGRNRSPSSSTAFIDLAHQGKRQLNSLMTFLNESGKNGGAKEGLSGRPEGALRGVRAKREADEADKEYRAGVHWLETLRLRRIKTLESGYKARSLIHFRESSFTLETFIFESADTTKRVLTKYADSIVATSSTLLQLTEHIEPMINAILPSEDAAILTAMIPRAMARDIPKPVLYYNYTVGECRDLIFGVALVDYATAHNLPEGAVPKVVKLCVKEVEARGMDTEGIYRVSGRHANVQELKYKVERDEQNFQFNPVVDDASSVASMLKLYLRELPEPVFRFPLSDRLQHTDEREEHVANNFPVLRSKLRRLPPVHQATLRCVVEHLARVSSRNQYNKMDAKNLAIVFGSVIFGEDELPKDGDILSMQTWKDTVMEDLITHAPLLFDEQSTPTINEPPLPAAPSGEPKPKYDYGSSYTRSHTLPPRSQDGQDFTPTLPPRPGKSIHPSHRSNPSSSNSDPSDQHPPSPTLPQRSLDVQSPVPQSHDPHVEAVHESSVTIMRDQESGTPDPQDLSSGLRVMEAPVTTRAETRSPKTPDTFATAVSSPRNSLRTGTTSRPASRNSTARSPSPSLRPGTSTSVGS
ncbi:RhoGAP-domain-containing protein [Ramaria rubella]|nr:RhoGAP-domain-containing protein [Ramaria rubella]